MHPLIIKHGVVCTIRTTLGMCLDDKSPVQTLSTEMQQMFIVQRYFRKHTHTQSIF